MFKFGGWRASLNFGGTSRRKEVYENGPDLSVGGAYRTHREEFFGRDSFLEAPKKLTPSMVKLPPSNERLKTSKSANDLTNPRVPEVRRNSQDISTDPRGGTSDNRNSSALHKNAKSSKDQQKKLDREEKKRLAEQKKDEKLAREQAKKDKLRIQHDRKIAEQQAKEIKARKEKENKRKAPQPLPQTSVTKPLVPQPAQRANPLAQAQYPSNTLESSISRSSGPPPYSEPKPPEKRLNKKDSTGNTSFGKPIENSSWDMISDHRNQMTRKAVGGGSSKQMVMDLQFSFDKAQENDKGNSEA